ncbi:MAG: hypothetical protein WAR76_06840 [Xanthobacteraceae bacterium]
MARYGQARHGTLRHGTFWQARHIFHLSALRAQIRVRDFGTYDPAP